VQVGVLDDGPRCPEFSQSPIAGQLRAEWQDPPSREFEGAGSAENSRASRCTEAEQAPTGLMPRGNIDAGVAHIRTSLTDL
jgi:hypothetical protein